MPSLPDMRDAMPAAQLRSAAAAPPSEALHEARPARDAPAVPWKRPLVVGAGGQLGTELCRVLGQPAGRTVYRTVRQAMGGDLPLDLATLNGPDDVARVLDGLQPDLILCPGAMTFVDGCEADPERARRTNAHGPAALAAYARSAGIPCAFYSSDYVFAGAAEAPGPYVESDPPRPLNVYGATKLAGERMVLEANPSALVLRTSWVYGPDAAGKNFISFLLRQLRARTPVRVPADQVSTPTLNRDLAVATFALLRAGASGVVHLTGDELMSREALARTTARFFGEDETLVEGVSTGALGQGAPRPLHSGLRSERLAQWLPAWRPATFAEGLQITAAALAQANVE